MSTGQVEYLGGLGVSPLLEQPKWYALRTRSRHEKMVADQLAQHGIENFLPLLKRKRQWSDRVKEVESPLFSGYTFVRMVLASPDKLRVLQTHGAAGLVGIRGVGVPIPDVQIDSLKTVVANGIPFIEQSLFQIGQRVRVRGGALDGIEGILAAQNDRTLVISVEPIQRSVSISVDGYVIEPV